MGSYFFWFRRYIEWFIGVPGARGSGIGEGRGLGVLGLGCRVQSCAKTPKILWILGFTCRKRSTLLGFLIVVSI